MYQKSSSKVKVCRVTLDLTQPNNVNDTTNKIGESVKENNKLKYTV